MVRGSRAGVSSPSRRGHQDKEGLTGVEIAAVKGAESEVKNLGHTSQAHLRVAPVVGVDALALAGAVEHCEAGGGGVEDLWARAPRGNLFEGRKRIVRDDEVQEHEGVFRIPDTSGE